MTPDEALAAAMKWTRVTTSQYDYTGMPPLPAQVMQRLNESGYSLVPTADLDRLRAVERTAVDLLAAMQDRFMGKANYYFGPNARALSDPTAYNRVSDAMQAVVAALGDRAVEEGR